jgi:hypothetical protein
MKAIHRPNYTRSCRRVSDVPLPSAAMRGPPGDPGPLHAADPIRHERWSGQRTTSPSTSCWACALVKSPVMVRAPEVIGSITAGALCTRPWM